VWLGANIGKVMTNGIVEKQNKTVSSFSLQSFQIMTGVNTNKFLIMAYYKPNNQSLVIDQMGTSSSFNIFGLILGYGLSSR
jgi:hypothetical protein